MKTYSERQAEILKIRTENAAILSTPLMSEGAVGPAQIFRMSKKQHAKWMQDGQSKLEFQWQIKQLARSDEQIATEENRIASEKRASRVNSLSAYLKTIEGLGRMSHLANGKLKKGYQIAVDATMAEIAALENAAVSA